MIKDTARLYANWLKVITQSHLSAFKKQTRHKHKSLLLIASHLPPNSGGGVFRPLSFLKNAPANQWACEAFALDFPVDNPEAGKLLLKSIPSQIPVTRIPLNSLTPSWALSPRIDGGFNNSLNMFQAVIQQASSKPDVVLATGPSFNSFLSGYYLSKFFRSPLVLDYRDEWTLCPFSWIEKDQMNLFFEKKCCQHAKKIIFTTQTHLERHQQKFPEIPAGRRIVIANGFEESDFIDITNTTPRKNNYFTLSFIGNLGQHALPDKFLHHLEELLTESPELINRLRIVFAGNKSEKASVLLNNFKFPQVIEQFDHMSKSEAVRMMNQSDALLILAGQGMSSYIPGKLFDYLASKKPILFFGETGEASNIINQLNAGLVVEPGNHTLFNQHITDLINKTVMVDKVCIDNWLPLYSRKALAETLFNTLNQLIEKR